MSRTAFLHCARFLTVVRTAAGGVPCGAVRTDPAQTSHPQRQWRGCIRTTRHLKIRAISYRVLTLLGLTAVSFWGQLGANYLELEWFVPETGMEFYRG